MPLAPLCRVGTWSCYCTCDPRVQGRMDELDFEDNSEGNSGKKKRQDGHDGEDEDSSSTGTPQEKDDTSEEFALAVLQAPPLGPVGSGGWHDEDEMTEEMRNLAEDIQILYEEKEKKVLTEMNKGFLTSVTLKQYVNPEAPKHLMNALKGRARHEGYLTGKEEFFLGCSCRAIGWDADGATVLAADTCTMKKSLFYIMPQLEYIGWSAFDMNKPGATGFSLFLDFGGGFNPLHFMNPKPISDLAALLEGQWRRRLKVAVLVEMPTSFRAVLNTFLMFVKETTRQKIKCVETMDQGIEELKSIGCDEETLANFRKDMLSRRMRDIKHTQHPMVDYSFFRERMTDLNMHPKTEYLTEEMHNRLREVIQEFRVCHWGVPDNLRRKELGEMDLLNTNSSSAAGKVVSFDAQPPQTLTIDVPSESSFGPRHSGGSEGRSRFRGEQQPPLQLAQEHPAPKAAPKKKSKRKQKGRVAVCFQRVASVVRCVVPCCRC